MALSNRDDGMDTFGNTGQLRIPTHSSFGLGSRGNQVSGGAANPFQNMGGASPRNNNNTLIDLGDSGSSLGRSNSNNPFQAVSQAGGQGGFNSFVNPQNGGQANSGFLSSQATGFGNFGHTSGQTNGNSGAYSNNLLF